MGASRSAHVPVTRPAIPDDVRMAAGFVLGLGRLLAPPDHEIKPNEGRHGREKAEPGEPASAVRVRVRRPGVRINLPVRRYNRNEGQGEHQSESRKNRGPHPDSLGSVTGERTGRRGGLGGPAVAIRMPGAGTELGRKRNKGRNRRAAFPPSFGPENLPGVFTETLLALLMGLSVSDRADRTGPAGPVETRNRPPVEPDGGNSRALRRGGGQAAGGVAGGCVRHANTCMGPRAKAQTKGRYPTFVQCGRSQSRLIPRSRMGPRIGSASLRRSTDRTLQRRGSSPHLRANPRHPRIESQDGPLLGKNAHQRTCRWFESPGMDILRPPAEARTPLLHENPSTRAHAGGCQHRRRAKFDDGRQFAMEMDLRLKRSGFGNRRRKASGVFDKDRSVIAQTSHRPRQSPNTSASV